jgi:hypothetical protein
MKKLELPKNLFELSDEEISTSKMIYENKIIKCLVAPYHSYEDIEKVLEYTPTTYLFPEKEMTIQQAAKFISMIVSSDNTDEVKIITSNQNIILDMVDGSVRVLTEGNEILPSPCKTFMANIHDIRYHLLENEAHQVSEKESTESTNQINAIMEIVREYKFKDMEKSKFDILKTKVDMIGEDVIRNILKGMLEDINVI